MQNASAFADLSRGRRSAGLRGFAGRKGSPNDLSRSRRRIIRNYEGVDSDLTIRESEYSVRRSAPFSTLVKSGRKWGTVQVSGKSRKNRQDREGGREKKCHPRGKKFYGVSTTEYLWACYYQHDKIQDRFSLNRVLLCDIQCERRVTSVPGDNNNAVINPREVSWNGGLIIHAKCSRNPRIESAIKLNRNIRDYFAESRNRFRINYRIGLF